MDDKEIVIETRKGSETDFEEGYSHNDIMKAISLAREAERKRIINKLRYHLPKFSVMRGSTDFTVKDFLEECELGQQEVKK